MIISVINGSPKPKDSNTEKYLAGVTKRLEDRHTIFEMNQQADPIVIHNYSVAISPLSEDMVNEIMQSDILLLGFPLYVDGIPSNLLRQMILLENAFLKKEHTDTIVYVIVNNGFYEGEQNVYAIEMVKHFSKRANLRFGMGLGIGTGEMQGGMIRQGMPIGKAVLTNLGKAMDTMVEYMNERKSGENRYVHPNFPWRGFQFMGDHTFWKAKAKANGISTKDMKRRLSLQKDR